MLRYLKTVPYIPDPTRAKPHITDHQKAIASETPPHAVPFHCKPWVDGQTLGWTLYYGYLTPVTITTDDNNQIQVDGLDILARETQQTDIISQFAAGHFGIGSGLTLQTSAGYGSLILPTDHAPTGLEAVIGFVETDWYPRQIFLVFRVPKKPVTLDYKTPLARVVVMPRQEDMKASPLTGAEAEAITQKRDLYLAEEKTTPTRWQTATGGEFTRLYKQWSKQNRKG